jgi:hypothetical protein
MPSNVRPDTTSSADPEPVVADVPSADRKPGSGLMTRRGIVTSAVAALTAIAGVTGVHTAWAAGKPAAEQPQPAASSPAAGEPEPTETTFEAGLWHRQELLSDLRGWTQALPGITTSGYITTINDAATGSIVLVWHGPANRIQQQIVDEARRRHITASIQQRNHSLNDLERATRQIAAIDSGTGVFQNFERGSVAPFDLNFDGVTVTGEYLRPPAEGIAAANTALVQALTDKTGVPVQIEYGLPLPASQVGPE